MSRARFAPIAKAGSEVEIDRHASVLCGDAQPLGVPAIFLQERFACLGHGGATTERERCVDLLVSEYAQATGYSFDWGQLMEQRLGEVTVWRIVPVALWTDVGRSASRYGGFVGLTGALHAVVRERVPVRPHPHVARSGCSGGGQRVPHALLSLLCAEPQHLTAVRIWLVSRFLGQALPPLLSACRSCLHGADGSKPERAPGEMPMAED